ncbi:MAG: lytic murein transglycosylase [Methyloceanibacter sp.]|uniref:lytic murein transglycosylase n=1 Tax=Methyloceanibacter sp. TaxID=1965321 RepID=UPI003D9BA0F5
MTRMMQTTARAGMLCVLLAANGGLAFAAACPGPAGFSAWLQKFKQQAIAQGISPETVSTALDGLAYDPATIAKDRGQGVFAQTFAQFSGRMVSANRMQMGSALLKKNADTFARIEQEYGVPGPVLVAFWGLETDFGKVMGNLETLRSLATLSYDCRRPQEFQEQLLYALRVIERGDLSPPEMRGPAHGEVGQFQFQPKNYFEHAVDFDGDGRRDLIRSAPDSLASAANYLQSIGWKAKQPWLEQVRVPADLPWQEADVTIKKPLAFWAQHGVTYLNGKTLPADDVPVGLVLPMGRNGPAFLAYPNFDIYLEWNKSLVYCTTAAYYATRLAGGPVLSKGNGPIEPLTQAQTKELQQLLARQGFDVGKIDGVIGAQTRDAIRTMQVKFGLPADSYPTAELLARMQGQ